MLEQIVSDTRRRLGTLRDRRASIEREAHAVAAPPDFAAALAAPGLSVIAEVKRKSPSRGTLSADLDPVEHAVRYVEGGASAISVLTEPHHFAGSDDDIVAVRSAVDVPVLRKDFTLDPLQIAEARAIGAAAVLLIVAILDDAMLADLHACALETGLAALVEVHSEREAERALAVGPRIVGVNNRDLTTFDVSLETSERIAPMLADVEIVVGESGIHAPGDAVRMREAGFDAVLVGESLVRSGDPAALIRSFRSAP